MTDSSSRSKPRTPLQYWVSKPEIVSLVAIITICSVPLLTQTLVRTVMARRTSGSRRTLKSAHLSESTSVHASDSGNPNINLADGRELLTSYVGKDDLRAALENNQAEALSLTAADFDEDGVPDLVSGYSYNSQGIVTLLRGNVDSIYPNAIDAKQRRANGTFIDAPFLSPGNVFAAPVAADFIGAGDFDADSHWDVVVGSTSSRSLYLMSGDGHGNLALTKEVPLPGSVTAMTTGEINRADGLADVVVGVTGPDGSCVLVFEGPEGALKAQPEVFPMPFAVSALALGQLDSSYEMDLAIGAGTELTMVHGRDRKLSLDAEQQQKVSVAQTEERTFAAAIESLVIGDFAENHQPSLALLTSGGQLEVVTPTIRKMTAKSAISAKTAATKSQQLGLWSERTLNVTGLGEARTLVRAKTSSTPGDDLLVLSQSQLRVVSNIANSDAPTLSLETASAPLAVLPLRLNPDALNDLVVLRKGTTQPSVVQTEAAQTFVVNTTADTDDGQCTVAADGCTLREAINAANANAGADTINFDIPGTAPFTINVIAPAGANTALPIINDSVTLDGTSQPNFTGAPIIEINGANGGNNNPTLRLDAGSCTIRGLVINRSGTFGIYLNGVSGVKLEGNYIGTDSSGTVALGSGAVGVELFSSSNNVIGGLTPGARNIISGNKGMGVSIFQQSLSNTVQGNYIGTDVSGTQALGNQTGLQVSVSSNNIIGGLTAGARNVISGNQFGGIQFDNQNAGSTSNNLVQGNYIGTDVGGTFPLGNGTSGVVVATSTHNNTIGGTAAGARNIISANQDSGVLIIHQCLDNNVQGNYIGTDVSGTQVLGNKDDGIHVETSNNNVIGGLTPEARNIISNNQNAGIVFLQSSDNNVQGNYIGTDFTGTLPLKNVRQGIAIFNSSRNTIGGDTLGARNVISGNGETGISLYGGPAAGAGPFEALENKIQGNFIGTDAAGSAKLPNISDGIQVTIVNSSANNTIGGSSSGMRNIISGNAGNGVAVGIRQNDPKTGQPLPGTGGTGITVQNNYIGTDISGQNCLGNTLDGLFVDADSFDNTFRDNLITCNGRNGVNLPQNSNPAVRIFMDNNSIFANASLGIDLGLAGITANDQLDTDGGANLQQNFPVLTTVSPLANSEKPDLVIDAVTINGTLNSAPNQTFTVHWYFSAGQCASNQAGNRPLVTGKVPGVNTNANGDAQFSFPFDFPTGVSDGIINCTATDSQNNTSEFSACFNVNSTPSPTVRMESASYTAAENIGTKTVTVTRTGSSAAACAVNYTTSDTAGASPCNSLNTGLASSRCDYETALGTLRFAAGEGSKTVSIPIIDDAYNEGNERFTITLSNPVNVSLDAQSSALITIVDDSTPSTNPISDATFFTKLHYFDFLNREADTSGLNFWRDQITSCGSDAGCIEVRRINVSASFFLSIEFQQTGYLVERTYKTAYGDTEKDSTFPQPAHKIKVPIIRFNEFQADSQQITEGVVVLAPGWEQKLESNKVAFFSEFVQRSRFITALPTSLTPMQFVDQLNTNAGSVLSSSERTTAINLFGVAGNSANNTARAQVMRQIAEDADLNAAEYNRAFVLMQYFGYLRRNPDDPQDTDYTGYEFWLIKLNQFGGNYINAEMVKAFLSSIEYNRRFGP